jgi:hypothetical protein
VSAPIPRRPRLARSLGRDQMRIRRLEVDGRISSVVQGVAGYEIASAWAPLTAAATFTPDLSLLYVAGAGDSIGCTPESTNLVIPPGWMWWANVDLKVKTTGSPTAGDFLEWAALNVYGAGSVRAEPMTDSSTTAQRFGATICGSSGGTVDGVYVPEFRSALGTVFVPTQLDITVTALGPFGLGFTGGIS